jgi:hypothetical protein
MQWMRRRYPDKPLVLAVNKCESPTLGPIQVSVNNKRRIGSL